MSLPWYESTLLWGALSIVIGIVAAVVIAMTKDFRWLLFLALPFASLTCWSLFRAVVGSQRATWLLIIGFTIVIAGGLDWLNDALAPKPTPITVEPHGPPGTVQQSVQVNAPMARQATATKVPPTGLDPLLSQLHDIKAATKRMGADGTPGAPTTTEAEHRQRLLVQLRNEYILSHDGLSSALIAGTEQPPSDWLNKRLEQLGESWRVAQPAQKPSPSPVERRDEPPPTPQPMSRYDKEMAALDKASEELRKPLPEPQKPDLKLYADSKITVLPVTRPSDGVLNVIQLQPNVHGNVIGQEFGSGSLAWTGYKTLPGPRIYTCKVTNYGAETVVNVTVAIRVTFSKMIDEGGGHQRSGAVRFDADCPFVISKIDPGIDNAYTFYIGNFWNEFVTVKWPDTATVATVGDSAVRVVPLAHPLGQLFFQAFEAPKPSAPHGPPKPQ